MEDILDFVARVLGPIPEPPPGLLERTLAATARLGRMDNDENPTESLDAYLERERREALRPGLFARLAVPKEWRVKDGGGG